MKMNDTMDTSNSKSTRSEERRGVGFMDDSGRITAKDEETGSGSGSKKGGGGGEDASGFQMQLLRTLSSRGAGVSRRKRKTFQNEFNGCVFLPWTRRYRSWWGFTVCCALLTIFTETFAIAFLPAGFIPINDPENIIELTLVAIFVLDIIINFNLAYFDEFDDIITSRMQIACHYLKGRFL